MMNRGNMRKQIAMPGRRTANMPVRGATPKPSGMMGGGMAPPAMQQSTMPVRGATPKPAGMMPMPMKKGGAVKKMAKGGMTRGDGCCMKGKTKGKMY